MASGLPDWFVETWVRCRLRVHGVGVTTGKQARETMRTREHWLLMICRRGSLRLDFADARWDLGAEDGCLIPPWTSLKAIVRDPATVYAQAHLNVGVLDGGPSPLVALGLPAPVALAGRDDCRAHLDALVACYRAWRPVDGAARLRANALGELLLLAYVEEGLRGDLPAAPGAPAWLWDLVRFVRQRPGRPELGTGLLASELGLTPDHVARTVRLHLGCTVATFVRRERMRVARDLLSNQPTVDVAGVAGRCGYDDPSHFARDFRREVGMSAREWRRGRS